MDFNLSSFLTLITALAGIGMPYVIAFVATSKKRWLNFVISYGSSFVLGIVASLIGGQFTSDISLNILVAIVAAQTAYNVYWKDKIVELKTKSEE